MNIKTLSISSLLLVASFIQCNDIQKVENSPQEDAFAAYLEMTELQKQFLFSEELKNVGIAMREHQIAINNLMLERMQCDASNNCKTSQGTYKCLLYKQQSNPQPSKSIKQND